MVRPAFKWTLALFGLLCVNSLCAQTNRYWPVNFDQESFLLSGAVIAGGSSLGSIYYNPASVAFNDETKVSLNSSIFSFSWYVFENGLGEDFDIRFNQISVLPPYVSFLLKSKKDPKLSVEFAVFTKEDQDLYVQEGRQQRADFYLSIPGEEVEDLFFNYSQRFSNLWIGAGLGYQLNDRLAVGLSNFIMFKSNRYINNTDLSIFSLNDTLTINGVPSRYFATGIQVNETTQSFNAQLRWKIGLTYQYERGSIGFTITTPSWNIINSAKSSLKWSSTNVLESNGAFEDDVIVRDQSDQLKSDFKDPFSIAFGLSHFFPRKKWEFYFTAEFFSGINLYKSIEGRSNPNAGTPATLEELGTDDILTQFRGANPVVNVAFGLKHTLPNNHFLILGTRTDFSSLSGFSFEETPSVNIPIQSNYDVYHLSSGYQFVFLKAKWVVGLEYAFGRRRDDFQFFDAEGSDVQANPGVINNFIRPRNMNTRFNSMSIFLGFDFSFEGKKGEVTTN